MSKKETKTTKSAKKEAPKRILYEAVQEHIQPDYVIVGALSLAGLLEQYRHEEKIYGRFNIEPSITDDELDKIIKNFIGE